MRDSDPMPLDGKPDLSEQERLAIRRIIRNEARMTWARKQAVWIVSGLATVAVALVAVFDWVRQHIHFK